jgi:hypothetical protein
VDISDKDGMTKDESVPRIAERIRRLGFSAGKARISIVVLFEQPI